MLVPPGPQSRVLTLWSCSTSRKIASKGMGKALSLAEEPKVGELQMDWLRSEDLKEEKVVTTPTGIIAVGQMLG